MGMFGSISDRVTLNNGVKMPILGFGSVFITDPKTIIWAIEQGFRNVDTAMDYDNEDVVGEAINNCGLPREELFVTTKLWNADHGYEKTLKAFDASLKRLNLDYVDLYLIHWPCPNHNLYIESWKAMEKLYKEGRIRAIGVSNFYEELLDRIQNECELVPTVNQVEYNPYSQHFDLHKYCNEHKIQIEAYMPIARGDVLKDPVIQKLAAKYGKTCIQITLRFLYQDGVCFIPRSSNKERIIENTQFFDFELTEEEMQLIRTLNQDRIACEDPHTFHTLKNLKEQIIDKPQK